MNGQWKSKSVLTNRKLQDMGRRFADVFASSFFTGAFFGYDYSCSGKSVGWTIVASWEPHASMDLALSEDSTALIVKSQDGDVSSITEMLAKEGLTFEE